MTLDDADRGTLDDLQRDFPIEPRPFAVLAERAGSTEEAYLDRVRRLVRDGVIRELGPVFDLRRLGHTSTLCAARVAEDRIDAAAALINSFPEVTHNYQRGHSFNVWFTVIASTPERIDAILDRVRKAPGVRDVISLPAQRMFKIDVFFKTTRDSAGGSGGSDAPGRRTHGTGAAAGLSAEDKRLVHVLSEPMPVVERPFAELGRQSGFDEEAVIGKVRSWISDGTIRRFGARVDHRAVGYGANGMSVWKVPQEQADTAGEIMALRPEVSHCYLRPPQPGWEYNLYAMIHGQTEHEVCAVAEQMADETGLQDYAVLFSSREFKKTAPRYFCT